MTEKTEILPCPFCGSGDVDAAGWLDGQGKRGPECLGCGATAQTVEYWNRRHKPEGADFHLDMVAHMHRQIAFSTRTFGPGERQQGVIDHIRKELREIEDAPKDLEEWIDVVLLALDGAWRSGHTAEEVVAGLDAKLSKNEQREWPDWRTSDRTKAIEHDRTKDRERAE